jgi:hypothetical protein
MCWSEKILNMWPIMGPTFCWLAIRGFVELRSSMGRVVAFI